VIFMNCTVSNQLQLTATKLSHETVSGGMGRNLIIYLK